VAKEKGGDGVVAKEKGGDGVVAKEKGGDDVVAKEKGGDDVVAKEKGGDDVVLHAWLFFFKLFATEERETIKKSHGGATSVFSVKKLDGVDFRTRLKHFDKL